MTYNVTERTSSEVVKYFTYSNHIIQNKRNVLQTNTSHHIRSAHMRSDFSSQDISFHCISSYSTVLYSTLLLSVALDLISLMMLIYQSKREILQTRYYCSLGLHLYLYYSIGYLTSVLLGLLNQATSKTPHQLQSTLLPICFHVVPSTCIHNSVLFILHSADCYYRCVCSESRRFTATIHYR